VGKEVILETRAVSKLFLVQRIKDSVECETDVDLGRIFVGR
jgi:hypothetical protein